MTVGIKDNVIGDWQWQYLYLTSKTSETAAGFTIAKNMEIDHKSMMLFVKAAHATKTIDVGILSTESGGDANGFLAALSLASTGWVKPAATATDGSSQNYISANTFGVLFFTGLVGADGAGTAGLPLFVNHFGDGTAKTMSYTCSSATTTFTGWLAFRYRQLPDPTNWFTG